MKTLAITLTLLMGFSSSAQFQSPVPILWQCSADCFTLGGNDGTNLYYYGNVKGSAYLTKQDAFTSLKNECSGDTLLLKRTFKGTYNQASVDQVFDRDITYYVHGYREHTRSYQVINTQTKAQFNTSEATEANSCEVIQLQDIPVNQVNGDPAVG